MILDRRMIKTLLVAAGVVFVSLAAWIHLVSVDMAPVTLPVPVVKAGNLLDRTAKYRRPRLSSDRDRLIIEGVGSSSGLAFEFKTTPHVKYGLIIRGNPLKGAPSLRLKKGNGPYEYELAPEGERRYTIVGSDRLQVLLFADSEFRYAMDEISLTACPGCKTDEDLRRLIEVDKPEALSADRVVAALAILDWVANRVNFDLGAGVAPVMSRDLTQRTPTRSTT